jgi:hypothetical protein
VEKLRLVLTTLNSDIAIPACLFRGYGSKMFPPYGLRWCR